MTVRQLRAFLTVAQSLSFARACERLHMSQPALSLAIKALEESLGGPLLIRTTRSVALTPEGEVLLPIARQLLAQWDNAEDTLRQHFTLQKGRVAIAAMPSFACSVLPRMLMRFKVQHPGIDVSVHDVVNEQVWDMVRSRRVELGIGFEPPQALGMGFSPLYVDRFIAVVPPASGLAACDEVIWDQLKDYPFITLQRPSTVRELLEEVYDFQVAFECHQLVTVGRMVAEGLGVSVVPELCREQMQSSGARCCAIKSPCVEKTIGLLFSSQHELSIAAQALAENLKCASSLFGSGQTLVLGFDRFASGKA